MVSPSKVQQQKQKPPPKDNKSQRQTHLRLQRGDKPLERKKFYLVIKNHVLASKLETKIKELGGRVELFLDQSVTLVVSDRAEKFEQINSEKRKWGYTSGGSVGPPSLRSVEVPTPTWTPPTPSLNGECPLSNSTNTRGQTAQRTKSRVDAMLERALTQPQQCSVDPLDNAHNWGIPIWTTDKLQAWLDKIYVSLKDTSTLKSVNRTRTEKDHKVKDLKKSYIKFESFKRDTRPVFLELPVWPTLNFHGEPGSCPFDTKSREVKEDKLKSDTLVKKKEMTRKPRATATRARRSEQLVAGCCEICRCDYKDLTKHVQSDKHLAFVRNNDNFLSLDTLINAGANVEAFLKLNQSDDVRQDLFSNGNDNLHSVIRSEKDESAKSDLTDFVVDDLKMVQCNGARRKLNLKLSSSHNLRTRIKPESGHLLRSKGSPWHEVEKNEKYYEKFEGFTIKKRSKGTIWIEEDDEPDNKCSDDEKSNDAKIVEKTPLTELNDMQLENKESHEQCTKKSPQLTRAEERTNKKKIPICSVQNEQISENTKDRDNSIDSPIAQKKANNCESRLSSQEKEKSTVKDGIWMNGMLKLSTVDTPKPNEQLRPIESPKKDEECESDCPRNGGMDETQEKNVEVCQIVESVKNEVVKNVTPRFGRINRRGVRTSRARQRLSVDERLIEQNRAVYKVEVLGNKLRSSAASTTINHSPTKEVEKEVKEEDGPSSEKPVVVRFKRVRKSELSLLSDEAESFMFGDSRKDDLSTSSDWNNDKGNSGSSILPKETESDENEREVSSIVSSPMNALPCSPIKQEPVDEDSQDAQNVGRARKRRRTQAEALIEDNADYYKFESPGSRLRFQGQVGEIKSSDQMFTTNVDPKASTIELLPGNISDAEGMPVEEKLYPSKPSAEVEKMRFSFEAVPKSEPWYQTYQRQDEGAEFWHCFSESDARKPFLLPYEIENFHETLLKICQKNNESRRKSRIHGPNGLGRSPRKSPRCHASTLAIMSTIIRKKEQQQQQHQQQVVLSVVDEEPRSRADTPKLDAKSSTDMELRDLAQSIDDMLNLNDTPDDSFEPETLEINADATPGSESSGPPADLLDILTNSRPQCRGFENSSCASSECGEAIAESPLKRRKRRKNRTGWPGSKIKRKSQIKPPITTDVDPEREHPLVKTQTTEDEEEEDEEEEEEEEENVENRNNQQGIRERLQTSAAELPTSSQDKKTIKCKTTIDFTECQTTNESEKSSFDDSLVLKRGDESNDENHENVFRPDSRVTSTRQQLNSKSVTRRRQRELDARPSSSMTVDSHIEIENHDTLYRQKTGSGIISRKNYSTGTINRKRPRDTRDSTGTEDISEADSTVLDSSFKKKDSVSLKKPTKLKNRQRKNTESNFDDQNCRKDQHEAEVECDRISPTPELQQQRRSSIEFQPVVRVMKIEDQVEIDQSILSVTVASNRRLRSSSSPKLSVSQPAKRYKRSKGPFGRWIKNS